MAAWRRPGLIDRFRVKLLDGMRANGLAEEFAQRVYQQIRGFGEYGFPESHAASFALLVYASAWLKHYYPAAFCAAMINSQPLGFYAPAQLVRDAREHGVEVRPADVNASGWDCRLEAASSEDLGSCSHSSFLTPRCFLRLGLRMLRGMRQEDAAAIEAARRDGPFVSFDDFARRTGLGQAAARRLAEADAFGSLGGGRRQALWHALGQEKRPRTMPLFNPLQKKGDRSLATDCFGGTSRSGAKMDQSPALPEMPLYEEVVADYRTAGLSLRAHPISFYREQLERLGITPAKGLVELPNGAEVRVAGIVLLRQRPSTAKGITFVTLEDETGTVNLVVYQRTWDRFYRIARRAPAWIAHGHVQTTKAGHEADPSSGAELHVVPAVIHVVVSRLEVLGEQLRQLAVRSRDFR
jgi:error-prone DNA polymerase